METNEQSSDKEFGQLEYSKPVCWCESTGHYTNPQGQELELRVRGTNPDIVDDYMKAVRISFEALPEREEVPEQGEPTREEDEKYKYRIDEEFKKLELHPELDLEIDLDVIKTPGIELPYQLRVEIDPEIASGATHRYKTKKRTKKIKVNLTASKNGVYGVLSGGGISPVTGQADTYPPDPPKPKASFPGEVSNASDFYFSVTGLKDTNKYTYGSSTKLERQDD